MFRRKPSQVFRGRLAAVVLVCSECGCFFAKVFCFFELTRPTKVTASMRPPCLVYLSSTINSLLSIRSIQYENKLTHIYFYWVPIESMEGGENTPKKEADVRTTRIEFTSTSEYIVVQNAMGHCRICSNHGLMCLVCVLQLVFGDCRDIYLCFPGWVA